MIINMDMGGDKPETVMIKEIQIDPVSRRILHADFVRVSLEEKVTAHVPISLTGTASGVIVGGVQEFLLRELQVECQVGLIPERIEIDISSLEIGDQIRVRDIQLPEVEMTVLDDPSTIVVTVVPPSVIVEEEPEEEEAIEDEEAMEPELIGEKRDEEEKEE
jgi:large subunit ribosomal protein L25